MEIIKIKKKNGRGKLIITEPRNYRYGTDCDTSFWYFVQHVPWFFVSMAVVQPNEKKTGRGHLWIEKESAVFNDPRPWPAESAVTFPTRLCWSSMLLRAHTSGIISNTYTNTRRKKKSKE